MARNPATYEAGGCIQAIVFLLIRNFRSCSRPSTLKAMVLLFTICSAGATADPKGFLLMSAGNSLYKLNLTTRVTTRLPIPGIEPVGLTYDPVSSRVVWGDRYGDTRILAAGLDGTGLTVLRNSTAGTAYFIERDTKRRRFYFMEDGTLLYSVDGDEGAVTIAIGVFSQISLHTQTNTLYYTSNFEVRRLQGNTSSRVFSRPGPFIEILGLTINPAGDTLYACARYFVNSSTKAYYYYKFSFKTSILMSLGNHRSEPCWGLATDGRDVYIKETARRFLVMPADGTIDDATILETTIRSPDYILSFSLVNPTIDADCPLNHCMNGGTCAAKEYTFVCLCTVDFTGHRCKEDAAVTTVKSTHLPAALTTTGYVGPTTLQSKETPTTRSVEKGDQNWIRIIIGSSVGVLVFIAAIGMVIWCIKKRNTVATRGKPMETNPQQAISHDKPRHRRKDRTTPPVRHLVSATRGRSKQNNGQNMHKHENAEGRSSKASADKAKTTGKGKITKDGGSHGKHHRERKWSIRHNVDKRSAEITVSHEQTRKPSGGTKSNTQGTKPKTLNFTTQRSYENLPAKHQKESTYDERAHHNFSSDFKNASEHRDHPVVSDNMSERGSGTSGYDYIQSEGTTYLYLDISSDVIGSRVSGPTLPPQ